MNSNTKAHIALFTANLLYGVNFVIAKAVMPEYVSAEALVFLRIVPTAILFWMVGFALNTKPQQKPDYKNLFLAAFFGVFLSQFLFIKGLSFSSPIDAAIIITSNPVLVMVVAAIVLKEKITNLKIFGIVVGACGALFLTGGNGFLSNQSEHLWGNLLLFANSMSFAIYMIYAKPLMQKYPAVHVLKWTFLFGAILYVPFGWKSFAAIKWDVMPIHILLALAYIVFATTAATYFLMNYGLRHLKSTTVSIYLYMQPVVSTVTAISVGVDTLSWLNFTASMLVFTGVYLVSVSKR